MLLKMNITTSLKLFELQHIPVRSALQFKIFFRNQNKFFSTSALLYLPNPNPKSSNESSKLILVSQSIYYP